MLRPQASPLPVLIQSIRGFQASYTALLVRLVQISPIEHVRKSFPSNPSNFTMATGSQPQKQSYAKLRGVLPTAPSSPSERSPLEEDQSLASLVEQGLDSLQNESPSSRPATQGYPTPPASSSSSSTQKEGVVGARACSMACRLGSYDPDGRPLLQRHSSGEDREVIRTRRQTAGLNPLSSIITSSSVHAAHISNPASRSASVTPSTPTSNPTVLSAHSALNSNLESAKLTDGVATSPRMKNTPPRTPRALSSDGSETDGRHATTSSPHRDGRDSHREASTASRSKGSSSAQSSPPVGPPKGKLSVKISEARGLKPSYDPYAVCVFEYNEAVARNPKSEDNKAEKDDALFKEFPLGGVPINRSGSDIGRSMAIPMKSRQSSTTSLSDQKNFKAGRQVTNPRWDHEAMLYAIL